MSNRFDDFVTITATGVNISYTGTSANAAIPNASDGNKPRYIRVAATGQCYVKLGASGVTAAAGDAMVQPADSLIMHVPLGVTHIAAIQESAAGKCNIVPLENV